jgi:ketosteroid isomerase-like protein
MTEGSAVTDELGILATVAEYCHAIDERGGQGVGDLFTEDARLTMMGQSFEGRAAITARLSGRDGGGLIHLAANPVVRVSGDTAAGTVDHLLLRRSSDGTLSPFAVGRWVDRYVRGASRWLLAERSVEFPYGPPPSRASAIAQ